MNKKSRVAVLVVVLLLISLPYLLAALAGGADWSFAGFLLNPYDGASYLAKMRQGWMGQWRFTLPFTARPGEGAYLFLFYIALGALARLLHLPLLWAYHLARVACAAALLASLMRFLERIFPDRPDRARMAAWLCALGSGMGWLVVFFTAPPSDFWVAEAYPFLSMYANPHFPLGLALLLEAFLLLLAGSARPAALVVLALIGLAEAVILPFGMVVMAAVGGAWVLWEAVRSRRLEGLPILALGSLGGPFLVYQYWATLNDPVLRLWNAQNVTPSPAAWDLLLSFSPALLLALVALWRLWKARGGSREESLLASWLVMSLALAAAPFALQRRFLLGLYIPTAALAVIGAGWLVEEYPRLGRALPRLLFGLSLPSTVLMLLLGVSGALGRAPQLYLPAADARAMEWLAAQTPAGSVIAASPQTGLWIPGRAGRRVVYGHPFETANAAQEEAWVRAMYAETEPLEPAALAQHGVDYVYYGPREQGLNPALDCSRLEQVFAAPGVEIYAVKGGR